MKTQTLKIELPSFFVKACNERGLNPKRYALGILSHELKPFVSSDGFTRIRVNGRAAEKAKDH